MSKYVGYYIVWLLGIATAVCFKFLGGPAAVGAGLVSGFVMFLLEERDA